MNKNDDSLTLNRIADALENISDTLKQISNRPLFVPSITGAPNKFVNLTDHPDKCALNLQTGKLE